MKTQEMKEKELKPCPFCGGAPVIRTDGLYEGQPYVECPKCLANVTRDERSDVIAAWNRRPASDSALEGLAQALYSLEPFDLKDPACQKCNACLRQERDEWVVPVLCDDCAQEIAYAAFAALASATPQREGKGE